MKYQRSQSFLADYQRLSQRERELFKAAVRRVNRAYARRGQRPPVWPRSLRMKRVRGHPGIWEMTWSFSHRGGTGMKIGLSSTNIGHLADPALMGTTAQLAEALGYDSLWVADHVVMADPSPRMSPTLPILDPLLSLVWLAAHTKTIQLATGIVILPQRQPVVLAKQLSTLDVLSGGRLMFGIGVGWQEAEMTACGARMEERGARADEYLAAMRALWVMEKPEYHGKFVAFAGVNAYPRPVQKPGPRLIMGGYAPATFRRTVRLAHGWYGYNQSVDQARGTVAALKETAQNVQRPSELGPLEITISPPEQPPSRETVEAYAEIGVHRLVIRPPEGTAEEIEQFVRAHAPSR